MKESFPWEPGRREMDTDAGKVQEPATGEGNASFQASFTDIDVNKHVAASRYLQCVLDSYPSDTLLEREPGSIEISFLAEAALGDHVTVGIESRDGHDLCGVRRTGDGKELCRVKTGWRRP